MSEMVIFAGRSNPDLFKELFETSLTAPMPMPKGEATLSEFSDGELFFRCNQSVRDMDCYVVQSTCHPHNDNLMELCIMTDALKRSSAKSVTAVIPYYGYARQDRQANPRTPITAKLVANMICASGVDRVVLMDIHSTQVQGFFDTPLVDCLQAEPLLSRSLVEKFGVDYISNSIIVSPDVGGVKRARNFSKRLKCGLAIIDKRRERANESEVMNIIGNVEDKHCILVDDIADTTGTLCQASVALMEAGARSVVGAVTHPVLSGQAIERIENSPLSLLLVTNSIPLTTQAASCGKICQVSCAGLLRTAIHRIHNGLSVSEIFN
jgi:ribose-phosphate pyrophosphokinase